MSRRRPHRHICRSVPLSLGLPRRGDGLPGILAGAEKALRFLGRLLSITLPAWLRWPQMQQDQAG
jgi:hypothetical protein